MTEDTRRIEIEFGAPVCLSREWQQRLGALLDEVCKDYEAAHSDRVMWVSGWGGKPLWREPEEPNFDMSVLNVECFERERYVAEDKA